MPPRLALAQHDLPLRHLRVTFGLLDRRTARLVLRTAVVHLSLNLTVTVAYAANFLLRDDGAPQVGWGLVALSLVSLAALAVSGYLGGKLAYRFGVRVASEATQAEGFRP